MKKMHGETLKYFFVILNRRERQAI